MCGLSQNLEIYMPILGYTLVRQDSNMINKRGHRRVEVDFWASLKHPLLGLVTGVVQDMSISGVALKLDEDMKFFVMMELDVRLHGEGWDDSMPSLPVQVEPDMLHLKTAITTVRGFLLLTLCVGWVDTPHTEPTCRCVLRWGWLSSGEHASVVLPPLAVLLL